MNYLHIIKILICEEASAPSKWKNGICSQKYHFWPKNEGEKWSGKIYFEIPPCGKIIIFTTEFVIKQTIGIIKNNKHIFSSFFQ